MMRGYFTVLYRSGDTFVYMVLSDVDPVFDKIFATEIKF